MSPSNTLDVGMDVHQESMAVASVAQAPWRGGHLPRHHRNTAVRYRHAAPATAIEEYAARLRLRSRPLRLLALSRPDATRLRLLGRRPLLDSSKGG